VWTEDDFVSFSPRRHSFAPRSVYVGFVIDKVALEQIFSESFSPVYIIPPVLHINSCVIQVMYRELLRGEVSQITVLLHRNCNKIINNGANILANYITRLLNEWPWTRRTAEELR
jgi:hypothetical protein